MGPEDESRALNFSARTLQAIDDFAGFVVAIVDATRLVKVMAAREEFVANVSHELRTPLTSLVISIWSSKS